MTPTYLTIHGSHGYGLNGPNSDMDHRGFFFQPPEQFFGLNQGPETVENNENGLDFVVWEFRKFVRMAAQCNPNVIETLLTADTDVLVLDDTGRDLRTMARHWFLSKKAEKTFGGYAYQQFLKLSKNFDKWSDPGVRKDAMHCVRLIYFVQELLETCDLTVKLDRKRHPERYNFMMGIRRGDVKAVPCFLWAKEQFDIIKEMGLKTQLPDEPKHSEIDAFVQATLKRHYGVANP
jgi:predicted nucleotidyltransferase